MNGEIDRIYVAKKLFLLCSVFITIVCLIGTIINIYYLRTNTVDSELTFNRAKFFIIISIIGLCLTHSSVSELKDNYDN